MCARKAAERLGFCRAQVGEGQATLPSRFLHRRFLPGQTLSGVARWCREGAEAVPDGRLSGAASRWHRQWQDWHLTPSTVRCLLPKDKKGPECSGPFLWQRLLPVVSARRLGFHHFVGFKLTIR